jgi:hypothetical protein
LTLTFPVVLVFPDGSGVDVAEPDGRVVTRVPVASGTLVCVADCVVGTL